MLRENINEWIEAGKPFNNVLLGDCNELIKNDCILLKVFVYCMQKPEGIKEMEYKKTKKGYLRFAKDSDGKLRLEHCIVWEKKYGKISMGMQIHHRDFDKTNNNIENLQLVTPLEHKRLHSGCRFVNNEWEKPCKICGEYKKINKENWYYSRGWTTGRLCKKCYIQKSLATRKILIAKGWKRKNYKRKIKGV